MSPTQQSLGDRMKAYENVTNTKLIHRMPIIMRVDGRAFHSFCKGMKKPYDDFFIEVMNSTAKYLKDNIPDCEIAFVESDEITLCLFPYKTFATTPMFDARIQKLCSTTAAMATWKFNKTLNEWSSYPVYDIENLPDDYHYHAEKRSWADMHRNKVAMFDCRCWNLPKEEVLNCLLWRQQDSKRNAISSAGQEWIGKKQVHGLKTTDIIDKLKEKNIDYWAEIPNYYHYGRTFVTGQEKTVFIFDNKDDRTLLESFVNCEQEQ